MHFYSLRTGSTDTCDWARLGSMDNVIDSLYQRDSLPWPHFGGTRALRAVPLRWQRKKGRWGLGVFIEVVPWADGSRDLGFLLATAFAREQRGEG